MPDAPQPPAAPSGELAPTGWSPALRLFYRLAFCYFLIYTLADWRFALIPRTSIIWTAIHVFHVSGHDATYFPTGSGDTALDYVTNYCEMVFAFLGAVVWSLLDRKRTDYITLDSWFRIWLRFTLARILLRYGFDKVFLLQMQRQLPAMVERWGDFSPFQALWTFMAASRPYEIFAGVVEVLPGLLLLFRRTTLLGAMISFAVMLNVAALNYCYDVPVKLFSTNLMLISVFLMGPDLRRLAQLLLLNRAALPTNLGRPMLPRRWMRIVGRLIQVLASGAILCEAMLGNWTGYKRVYLHPQPSPIHGLYEVETFSRNGHEAPPLLTDAARWHWLYVQTSEFTVVLMNDDRNYYEARQDPATNIVTLSTGEDKSVFTYSWSDTNHLVLRGSVANDAYEVRLRKVAASDFLLLNRGFHWINEYPFAR
jgi:uncharacterized membrane protein YphA (DoxX/SURF4 family)